MASLLSAWRCLLSSSAKFVAKAVNHFHRRRGPAKIPENKAKAGGAWKSSSVGCLLARGGLDRQQQGRSGFGVFVMSVLLSRPSSASSSPLVMQRADKIEATQVVHGGVSREFWKCPFCAEAVRFEAIKCKHCGSDLSTPEVAEKRAAAVAATNSTFKSQAVVKILLIVTVLAILGYILNH
ncbi:MAG: hypothetical protein U1F17_10455 [Burkholderiaceae bacterium]